VEFVNKASIPFDAVFWISRIVMLGLGVLAFVLAERAFRQDDARRAQDDREAAARRRLRRGRAGASRDQVADASARRAADGREASGFLARRDRGRARRASRAEERPGLYLFIPLILLQTLGSTAVALGPFGTFVLATPGTIAVRMINYLSLLVALLLLFYTVESHQREKHTGLASIFDATPVRTGSVLFGKSVANAVVGIMVMVGCFIGAAIVILAQGQVPLALTPFVLTWGLLLVPTFLLWTCFVTAAVSITRNRYATYGVGLVALIATGWFQARNKMNWVFNWDLWNAVRWSDMGPFQMDRSALVVNRLLALSLAAFFVVLAVMFHGRRDADPVRIFHRLRPRSLWWTAMRLAPFALAPAVLATTLGVMVTRGEQSDRAKKKAHDYWKQNLATWKDARSPRSSTSM
jgi:hypothetical protein